MRWYYESLPILTRTVEPSRISITLFPPVVSRRIEFCGRYVAVFVLVVNFKSPDVSIIYPALTSVTLVSILSIPAVASTSLIFAELIFKLSASIVTAPTEPFIL